MSQEDLANFMTAKVTAAAQIVTNPMGRAETVATHHQGELLRADVQLFATLRLSGVITMKSML